MPQLSVVTSNTILTYSLMTAPEPVQVSPATGSPSMLTLTFAISCPQTVGQLTVSSIAFTLPVGDANDPVMLTDDASAVTASVTSTGMDQWQIGPGVAPGSFLLTPLNGQPIDITTQALLVKIKDITVSKLIGTAAIEILEASNAQNSPRRRTVGVAKFPDSFYLTDFTADSPQIALGQTVNLTWQGSQNAKYDLTYGNQKPIDVSAQRSWHSPPLYSTTAFYLVASTTVNNQTVSMGLNTTVVVSAPDIVSYGAMPSQIDYQQSVTLDWHSVNADGVYLLTGQSARDTLPAQPDPKNPKSITPAYGTSYALQAFDTNGQTSRVLPLAITFNALGIHSFTATPAVVDLQNQTTTLAWDVRHAKSVTFQKQPVDANSSQSETPKSTTTYTLEATWVDGTVTTRTVDVPVHKVTVNGAKATFVQNGNSVTVTLTFDADYVTSGALTNVKLMFCDREHWYRWGHPHQTASQNLTVAKTGTSEWQASTTFDGIDPSWLADPNIGIGFDYAFEGLYPVSVANTVLMWKGQFTFWNGS